MNERTSPFHDIYGYEYTSFWLTSGGKACIVAMSIVGIIGLFLALYGLYKWRQRKKELSPWEVAIAQLSILEKSEIAHFLQLKKGYFALIDIFTAYLLKRFGWKVEDKTEEELILFLKEKSFEKNYYQPVADLLARAMNVKFSLGADKEKEPVSLSAHQTFIKDSALIKTIVTITIPKEVQ
jgi:hypothetical protein